MKIFYYWVLLPTVLIEIVWIIIMLRRESKKDKKSEEMNRKRERLEPNLYRSGGLDRNLKEWKKGVIGNIKKVLRERLNPGKEEFKGKNPDSSKHR